MMIKSIDTARGAIILGEATLADAIQFRELRLYAGCIIWKVGGSLQVME